ncbi:gluconate 2-dehydrogenase subunit 3 family protein [Paenibacillus sp. sptzw28]|uniref:gluconate 2-dehydrogenase subunit 3 family protein n=1 Tax=Paenibacillus sp. sptzw28 TaxID=715179 RepID=UPI001C6E05C8|nr:gluconate 2-dehydrogenase subunit 3 family protein [Paenibacillus sp. sptzw28]QYR20369.1 gluconate 2-dehydrogenase subunit 3 family protein [Paenibacillus sp. sptzw28]
MVSNEEIEMIKLLTEAIFPGANQARVYEFILRDMKSNPFFIERYREGLTELDEAANDVYRSKLLELNGSQLTGLLTRFENSAFFELIRDHTMEGMFSDPIYGGNYEALGWRLLGYAGPTFHPPETIGQTSLPTVYYSLEGIAYEEKT